MSKQSRIGLLISLTLVVAFAMVISELWVAGDGDGPAAQKLKDQKFYAQSPVINARVAAKPRQISMPRPRHMRVSRQRSRRQYRYARTGATARQWKEENRYARTGAVRRQSRRIAAGMVAVSTRHQVATVAGGKVRRHAAYTTYVVKPGDNLTRIARIYYGRDKGKLYTKIFEANRDVLSDAGTVCVGMKLKIPQLAALRANAADAAGGVREMSIKEFATALGVEVRQPDRQIRQVPQVHVVQAGDNLTTIARKYLDDASRAAVTKIMEANRGIISDPDHLEVGMKLRIPA